MLELIKNKNGTLTDYVVEVNDVYSGTTFTLDVDSTTDYLYIGANFAFNHFYLDVSVANTTTSTMSIETWDGSLWKSVARVIDSTSTSGSAFAASGYVEWFPDKNEVWSKDDTENITGLTTISVYDQYWIRVSFSSSLDATTKGLWAGQKFSSDNDLKREFPQLLDSDIMDAYETGKTGWFEQHVLAAKLMEDDLKDKGVINDSVQLIRLPDLTRASVSKVGELIYSGFGKDNLKDQEATRKEYKRRIGSAKFLVDENNNALVDDSEKTNNASVRFVSR